MYESNTNTNTENKKAFQKWLAQCPENAFIDYQKQFREDPKKFKVVISFEQFLFSQLIATTQTQNNVQPKQPPNRSNYHATQKTNYCNDFIFIFFFVCQLVRTRTHKRLSHPTPKREIIHARTQYTTPHQLGFFIVCWLHYPPHQCPTHRTPHAQATAPAGHRRGRVAKCQKIFYLTLNLLINLQIKTTFSFLLRLQKAVECLD